MKIGDHLPNSRDPAGHAANHVMLIAVVDSHVRIGRPDQYRIDPSISLLQIIEITVHGIAMCDRIVEVAIFHHHLRLEETGLRPLQSGEVIPRAVVANSNATLVAPMLNVGKPRSMLVLRAWFGTALPRPLHRETAR